MTENILNKIIANKKLELEQQKHAFPQNAIIATLLEKDSFQKGRFKDSLINSNTGIIAEFKRRSPSRGWIFENAKIEDVVTAYTKGGASAISVLTDIDFFGGILADLDESSRLTHKPLLRKDFTIDEYQLYQAAQYGASAILLIASALTVQQTKELAKKANELSLDVLLEIHNERELEHINEYVDVVGVNNRNLSTFVTDIQISFDLADKIPTDFVKISESGISQPQSVRELREAGYRGFLMGENFMKTNNPGKALEQFIRELENE